MSAWKDGRVRRDSEVTGKFLTGNANALKTGATAGSSGCGHSAGRHYLAVVVRDGVGRFSHLGRQANGHRLADLDQKQP